jgi:hypothetical protein
MTVKELIDELVYDHAVQTGVLECDGTCLLDLVEEFIEAEFNGDPQAMALATLICEGQTLRPMPRLAVSN